MQRNENKTFHMGDIKENKEETYHEVYGFQRVTLLEMFKVILNYSSAMCTKHVRF